MDVVLFFQLLFPVPGLAVGKEGPVCEQCAKEAFPVAVVGTHLKAKPAFQALCGGVGRSKGHSAAQLCTFYGAGEARNAAEPIKIIMDLVLYLW